MIFLLEAAAIDWLGAGVTGCPLCDERMVRPYSTIKLNGRQQQFKPGPPSSLSYIESHAFCIGFDVF
jgi:hypothetical protein